MQNLQETQDQQFQEVKNLAKEFSGYSSKEDFIHNIKKIKDFSDKVSTLKVYDDVLAIFQKQTEELNDIERKVIDFEIDIKQIQDVETVEASVEKISSEEKIDEEYFIEKEEEQTQLQKNIEDEIVKEFSEIYQAKEEIEKKNEEERLQAERRKIIEIEKPVVEEKPASIHQEVHSLEKKFKLANIKGLKTTVKSLFDDDPLENLEEEKITEPLKNQPSLVKTNVPTDYLEAKPFQDFKLDINDRLAFTKVLFGGSQVELNQTINRLNSFKTLEEAKGYLSEVYYERNWQDADEYAQRLWNLVESKFL